VVVNVGVLIAELAVEGENVGEALCGDAVVGIGVADNDVVGDFDVAVGESGGVVVDANVVTAVASSVDEDVGEILSNIVVGVRVADDDVDGGNDVIAAEEDIVVVVDADVAVA
jgi:hypothetical protein